MNAPPRVRPVRRIGAGESIEAEDGELGGTRVMRVHARDAHGGQFTVWVRQDFRDASVRQGPDVASGLISGHRDFETAQRRALLLARKWLAAGRRLQKVRAAA